MTFNGFQVPLVVYEDDVHGFILISKMGEASDFLFRHWPGNNTPIWTHAMSRCDGGGSTEEAKDAFVMALQSVGIRCETAID